MRINYKVQIMPSLGTLFDKAMASAKAGATRAVEDQAVFMRDAVADKTAAQYGEDEEKKTLMQGFVTEGNNMGGRLVGTDEGGRLVQWTPLHRIIRMSKPLTLSIMEHISWEPAGYILGPGKLISAQICRADEINELARFWYERRGGSRLQANPFNGRYIESVEDGGVWDVRPRSDNKGHKLSPEWGVLARAMSKTITPQLLFKSTVAERRRSVVVGVGRMVKQYVAFAAGKGAAAYDSGASGGTLVP